MLSNSCKYAIRSVIYLALNSNVCKKIGSKEVALKLNMPQPFLAKILQELTRKHLVSSTKGPNGGFYLTDENLNNKVIDIVSCIDGLDALNTCFLGLDTCSTDKPCSMHHTIEPYKNEIILQLSDNTIAQFADEIRKGNSFLSLE